MGTASTKKFIKNSGGALAEEAALTTSGGPADHDAIPALNANGILDPSIVNAKVQSLGASDANKIPMLDSSGRLDNSVMPSSVGADTVSLVAFEALSAGDFVNIYSNAGTANARKADASANKPAHGFVTSAFSASANATVYLSGQNASVSTQTPGEVFLQGTAGKAGASVPTTSGFIVQSVGIALTASIIEFRPQRPITLA